MSGEKKNRNVIIFFTLSGDNMRVKGNTTHVFSGTGTQRDIEAYILLEQEEGKILYYVCLSVMCYDLTCPHLTLYQKLNYHSYHLLNAIIDYHNFPGVHTFVSPILLSLFFYIML